MINIRNTISLFLFSILFSTALFSNEGYLGVSVKSYTLNFQDGLLIVDVFNDGAAFSAGLLENDFITAINGEPVSHPYDLKGIIRQLQWGDKIKVDYIRDGIPIGKEINLGYKAYTRTYEIIKSKISDNKEEWFFKDSTAIVFLNGEPVTMTKTENGLNEALNLSDFDNYEAVPQKFLDLNDKLFVIAETKRVQGERASTASNVVVFKEVISTELPTSIIYPIEFSEFTIAPNPNKGSFKVNLMSSDMENEIFWSIYDIQGRTIDSGKAVNDRGSFVKDFKLANVAGGNYLLYIQSGDKRISSQFVIE
jgi:hypothetical protein